MLAGVNLAFADPSPSKATMNGKNASFCIIKLNKSSGPLKDPAPGVVGRLGTNDLSHGTAVQSMEIAPDGESLATLGAGTDEVIFWDLRTGARVSSINLPEGSSPCHIAFSSNGNVLAVLQSTRPNRISLLTVPAGREIRSFVLDESGADSLCFSPDDKALFCGVPKQGNVKRIDIRKGKRVSLGSPLPSQGENNVVTKAYVSEAYAVLRTEQIERSWRSLVTCPRKSSLVVAVFYEPQYCQSTYARWGWSAQYWQKARSLFSGVVRIWSWQSNSTIEGDWQGAPVGPMAISFSPSDRDVFATANREIYLWRISSGEVTSRFGQPDAADIVYLAYSSDGNELFSGDKTGNVCMWDTNNCRLLSSTLSRGGVKCMAVSSKHRTVAASAPSSARIQLWNTVDWKPIVNLPGNRDRINTVEYARNNDVLISGDTEGGISIWDIPSGRETFKIEGYTTRIVNLASSPKNHLLACADANGTVSLWDLKAEQLVLAEATESHSPKVLRFSCDGNTLVMAGYRGMVIFHLRDDKWQKVYAKVLEYPCGGVAFSQEANLLALAQGNKISLFDANACQEGTSFVGHEKNICEVVLSQDGSLMASRDADKEVRFWDVRHTKPVSNLEPLKAITGMTFASRKGRFVSIDSNNIMQLVDLVTGTTKKVPLHAKRRQELILIGLLPDETAIMLWHPGGTEVRDVESGDLLWTVEAPLHFSREGNVAVSFDHAALNVWDVKYIHRQIAGARKKLASRPGKKTGATKTGKTERK